MPATLADIQAKYGGSVYPSIYKDQMHEPYMESDNGIGYRGAIMYNEVDDKIQCGECGKWLRALGVHLKTHSLNEKTYKEKHGLRRKTALCSKKVSRKRSEISQRCWAEGIFTRNSLISARKARKNPHKGPKINNQSNNEYGLCDAQISARLMVVLEECGKGEMENVTSTDIQKYDSKLLNGIGKRYGNYKIASKSLGLKYVGAKKIGEKTYSDIQLLSFLRQLTRELNKDISMKDMRESTYCHPTTYYNRFGSWRRAKVMAGLDQLLEEVKNK